jgi:dynactin complex subunit
MESDLRDRLADINDELKEIIPQLEWKLDETEIAEVKEARIMLGSTVHLLDIEENL